MVSLISDSSAVTASQTKKEQPAETYPTQMTKGSLECFGHPRLFSHVLLERILTFGRLLSSPLIIYYDVTNFYFEIEELDEDILDEDGNVLEKGQRKMAVCKEERKLPILQMGLFMDDDGFLIAVESFPGNTLDHLTLRPALKRNIDDLDLSRFILIADRGICNYMNLLHVLDAGNGYIVSKSLLKSTK